MPMVGFGGMVPQDPKQRRLRPAIAAGVVLILVGLLVFLVIR
jgi:hypothetical protein